MLSIKGGAYWNPTTTGMAVTAMVAVLLTAVGPDPVTPTATLASVPLLAFIFGMVIGLLHSRRLWSVFWSAVFGLLVGGSSSWSLIGHRVPHLFPTVVVILALCTAIGLLVGGFIEFVQLLHYIAHGNDVNTYRSDRGRR